ncbi:MarR family transcriptional regulator [Leptospira biflexa]|uniref:MarR family winged helix-turn-helix transcriptional regulator n=1 Tax=Leptospira biflexa TaxID=172 RepID=UPI001084442C|nr:MarR family transcriptional regulator [Leptospira biflexa]TGM34001.1 MarR family transcriptional regulator [Leptospira biflexa]TGM39506.1 MarR family transcriptional regulator [Leptospira biflexa]TGM41769.1 MarR family transcriptional regulator [Leptospira biflexa]TGM51919.1 MarR family transcriptional regulator [Leptospira biflexa]
MSIHPEKIIHLLSGISDRIFIHLTSSYKKEGYEDITPPQGAVLCVLRNKTRETMTSISKQIYRDRSTVTQIVKKLEINGYVERDKNINDSRISEIFLTEKGKIARVAIIRSSRKMFSRIYKNTTFEERRFLISLLEKIDSGS